MIPCGHVDPVEGCTACHWRADPGPTGRALRLLWGVADPAARSGPCRHLGAPTGDSKPCVNCQRRGDLVPVRACGRFGVCHTDPTATLAAVRRCDPACEGYEPATADPGQVRHLIYHVYPLAGDAWRWNLTQLKRRLALFNGRRVIGVAVGPNTEPASAVRAELADCGCEFIEAENVPKLGEMTTFPALLGRLSDLTGPDHVTFYGHTKGVTSKRWSPTVRRWAAAMYETCLDYWPTVRRLLRTHPVVGTFKRTNFGWPGESHSTWHVSGTFRWTRNADLYSRNWREIDRFWSGSESHPSLHFRADECAALVLTFSQDGNPLYEAAGWDRLAEPALAAFRREHAADRWSPNPPLDFAVASIVHDEGPLVRAFCEHYRSHGASRIVLVDNESTDGACEAAVVAFPGLVEARRLASGGLDEELRTATFQQVRESLADYDWVLLADADEFLTPKHGGTIRQELTFRPDASCLGCEGWQVVQRPGEPPLDWSRPLLAQRTHGYRDDEYSKPVVLRPGGPERLHAGQHRFRKPHAHPAETPFLLYHLAAADEALYLSRRLRMTARQTPQNVARRLSVQHTGQTEETIRRRWAEIQADPHVGPLPGA